ncbi:uncharacterized protein LOC143177594 [Calliopsis andreniformis]|uniref:uncharacterized protein LOC143177594 n=1 Tax=Calliopsis andreniformis TaxID=337506 RepID=UPI003FCD9EFD
MVHSSNPRLMNRVLDAVVHLCEGKGSTARDVLDFLRQGTKGTPRNLTMQVHRALKHAVNAGLLRHRSGRYKALFTLNPAPVKQSLLNECNDGKSVDGTITFDAQQARGKTADRKEENRGKHRKSRRDKKRKRSRSRQRKRRRRSGSDKSDEPCEHIAEMRKLKYKEKGHRSRSPRRRITDNKRMKMDIASTSSCNRKRSKGKRKDEEYYSDLSDSSYEDEDTKPTKSSARQEPKYEGNAKQGRRSASRNRSPQRQQSQQLQAKRSREDVKSNKLDSENCKDADQNDEHDQNVDKDHEHNSGSGCSL